MKQGIHPKIYSDAQVKCACGSVFTTISTKEKISVEICSACHPFYTGQQKFVDTEGRIDKFRKKQKISEDLKSKAIDTKKTKEAKKPVKVTTDKQPTLKELLDQSRQSNS